MKTNAIAVPGCINTTAEPMKHIRGGQSNFLLVRIGRDGSVPLHRHNTWARMIPISGRATFLGPNGERIPVQQGQVIETNAEEEHGFCDIEEEFVFVSESGGSGILQGQSFDMQYRF